MENLIDKLYIRYKTVHSGQVWLELELVKELASGRPEAIGPEEQKIGSLTDRERQVVSLLGEGLRNKQIADRLTMSETTVRHHLSSIFGKLGVSDRTALVIFAYRHGLIELPARK